MRTRSLVLAGAALAALALLAATTTAGAASQRAVASACVPKHNIEAIVDDSGSMSITDSNRLRVQAMDLLINSQPSSTTLGAIEFGDVADTIFKPEPIGGNAAAMKSALDTAVQADNGTTDYNLAFQFAGQDNPNADARIFLTDGEHTAPDPYANGHRGGPPVYVIGLGVFDTGETVLKQIASETGGLYRRTDDSSELQPAMFDLESAISCLATPITLKNTFTTAGQTKKRSVRLPSGVRSVKTALTWANPSDKFDIFGIHVVRKGKTVAKASRIRHLKVTKRRGATFETVQISRLVRGKLVFKLRARKLTSGGSVNLTTQLVRSKHH